MSLLLLLAVTLGAPSTPAPRTQTSPAQVRPQPSPPARVQSAPARVQRAPAASVAENAAIARRQERTAIKCDEDLTERQGLSRQQRLGQQFCKTRDFADRVNAPQGQGARQHQRATAEH
jgi:hypothetical protein